MNKTAQTYLTFCEQTEGKVKKISFGALMTGILLMQATNTHDVVKAIGNHSLTALMAHLRKNLVTADPDKAKEAILAYLATDPEAEKAKREAEKAKKEAEKAKRKADREAEAKAKKASREAELLAFFGTTANEIH